jgi:hypothetical protein
VASSHRVDLELMLAQCLRCGNVTFQTYGGSRASRRAINALVCVDGEGDEERTDWWCVPDSEPLSLGTWASSQVAISRATDRAPTQMAAPPMGPPMSLPLDRADQRDFVTCRASRPLTAVL